MPDKKRLDIVLVDKGLVESRSRAKALIMAGRIVVDGQRCDKPGTPVSAQAAIDIKGSDMLYVSRGGLKLAAALDALSLRLDQWVCLDVGASTGGFTDCMLQYGAARVYAVDVGYGQLAWPLRQDSRVVPIERTNIRNMRRDRVPEPVDLASIDTSFISLRIVVPAVQRFLKPDGRILALIKPQFEVGKGRVGKGGVVKDPKLHQSVIEELTDFFHHQGLECGLVVPSPILGPKGNKEFVIYLYPSDSVL